MPKLLEESEIDPATEALDNELAQLTEAEKQEVASLFPKTPAERVGDLSNGGHVNGVEMYPTRQGERQQYARPNARRAWTLFGAETILPLGWNPEGTRHDGARPYLLKMFCLCCMEGGFRTRQCPKCVKSNCQACGSSTDSKKIVRAFYLRKEDVPFPRVLYGKVDCFLVTCPRRGDRGFHTSQDMRLHARTKHRLEYQSYLEAQTSDDREELASLRSRLDALQAAPGGVATQTRKKSKRSRSPSTRNAPGEN